MKHIILINQLKAVEWGLNLSQAAIFAFCYELPAWAETVIINDEIFYFAARQKGVIEMPIVTEKPDTIYRIFKTLEERGLVVWRKFDGKDCIKLTEKAKLWNSENFPSVGKKSEITRKKIRDNSENFPTYTNTIDKRAIDTERDAPAQKIDFSDPFKYKETATTLINHLKDNPGIIDGMKTQVPKFADSWAILIEDYLLNLQSAGNWYELQVPSDAGKFYAWRGKIIAGAVKWAKARVRMNKNGETATGPAKPLYKMLNQ